jgi:hypothetical protein
MRSLRSPDSQTVLLFARGSFAALDFFRMSRAFKATVGVTLIALLIAAAAYRFVLRDPFAQPGQSWKNKTPHTWELLRLLESGKYAARVWCDVCPVRVVSGTWSRSGDVITLRPDKPGAAKRELIEMQSNGCRLLAHPKAMHESGVVNPLMAHLREGEPCEVQRLVDGYVRKL